MHDSGKRQEFTTGAVRDTAEGKPRIDLISPFAEARLGAWSALGAAKYSDRNWEAGMPFSRILASLCRHLNAYRAGDRSEDHLAAVMWNAMALAHGEEMVKRGVWGGALADLPDYGAVPAAKSDCPASCSDCRHRWASSLDEPCCVCEKRSKWETDVVASDAAVTRERPCAECKHQMVSALAEPCNSCKFYDTHPAWVHKAASV